MPDTTSEDKPEAQPPREPEAPPKRPVRETLSLLHRFVEACGRHPFATGLFALLGLAGLILSIVGFQIDREEASSSTEQVARVEEKIDELSGRIGTEYNGGVFLFEERIEIYWNEWWAHPISTKEQIANVGQAEMTIRGEGKTVDFTGLLSINCENGKYIWRGVQNFYNSEPDNSIADELVPKDVIRNATRLFCRPR